MKKIINIIFCGLSLGVIEYILLYFFIVIEGFVLYTVPKAIIVGSLRDANEISLTRFVFYFVFWVIAINLFYNKINIKNPILKMAVINCGLYISLSILLTLFFPFAIEFFGRSFFFFLTIATFLSPFILSISPYFRDRIEKIETY
jgi:hypothetical protein